MNQMMNRTMMPPQNRKLTMYFAEHLKIPIYVASRTVNSDGVSVYGTPSEYRVNCYNVLPTSASADLVTVGTSITGSLQVLGDPDYLSDIEALDKVYVYNSVPEITDQLAVDADYYVDGVITFPNCTRITLRDLTVD